MPEMAIGTAAWSAALVSGTVTICLCKIQFKCTARVALVQGSGHTALLSWLPHEATRPAMQAETPPMPQKRYALWIAVRVQQVQFETAAMVWTQCYAVISAMH